MLIHEYQAKEILSKFGIPMPVGGVYKNSENTKEITNKLSLPVVIKAQVHAGGRGKAGGVKLAKTLEEVENFSSDILNLKIKGLKVEKILIEKALNIQQEFYLGITIDRNKSQACVILSPVGGIEIEEVARTQAEKIYKEYIDPVIGWQNFQAKKLAYMTDLNPSLQIELIRIINSLYKAFAGLDATLAEVNPLVLTQEETFIAADAKINLDDSALFRHPELLVYREAATDDEIEKEAHHRGIAYVKLDGDIGIIGNGAGLVMTTLDMVAQSGGKPANFLDIGGGAKSDVVKNALELVLLDKRIKGILFNIFGGITRCDEVAKGIIEALKETKVNMPMVIRLSGTKEEEGKKILENANLISTSTMKEGAEKIVKLTK